MDKNHEIIKLYRYFRLVHHNIKLIRKHFTYIRKKQINNYLNKNRSIFKLHSLANHVIRREKKPIFVSCILTFSALS